MQDQSGQTMFGELKIVVKTVLMNNMNKKRPFGRPKQWWLDVVKKKYNGSETRVEEISIGSKGPYSVRTRKKIYENGEIQYKQSHFGFTIYNIM